MIVFPFDIKKRTVTYDRKQQNLQCLETTSSEYNTLLSCSLLLNIFNIKDYWSLLPCALFRAKLNFEYFSTLTII